MGDSWTAPGLTPEQRVEAMLEAGIDVWDGKAAVAEAIRAAVAAPADGLVASLREIMEKRIGDEEWWHGAADRALMDYFDAIGRPDVRAAFDAIPKWYA
jgi:hypothetical protein